MRAIAREMARAERARQREQAAQAAAALRAVRNAERQAKADAKEAARLYVAARIEEAEELTRAVKEREELIDNLLTYSLSENPAIGLSAMLRVFVPGTFDEAPWKLPAPNRDEFIP